VSQIFKLNLNYLYLLIFEIYLIFFNFILYINYKIVTFIIYDHLVKPQLLFLNERQFQDQKGKSGIINNNINRMMESRLSFKSNKTTKT